MTFENIIIISIIITHKYNNNSSKSDRAARASSVAQRMKGPAMITVKTKESARAIESFFLVFFCQSGERKNARQLQRSVKAVSEAPSE